MQIRHPCLIASLIFAGSLVMAPPIRAEEPADCTAASRQLDEVAAVANHCRRAADCGTVAFDQARTVGCGLLFNQAERPAVQAAVEAYARLCSPHWHCRAWPATHDVDCVDSRCAWTPRPATIEDLRTREETLGVEEKDTAPP